MNVVAQSLARLRRVTRKADYATATTILRFEKLWVHSWPADSRTSLVLFCLPNRVDVTVLDMVSAMALEDLRHIAEQMDSLLPNRSDAPLELVPLVPLQRFGTEM
jgi:hypothetical protein